MKKLFFFVLMCAIVMACSRDDISPPNTSEQPSRMVTLLSEDMVRQNLMNILASQPKSNKRMQASNISEVYSLEMTMLYNIRSK